MMTIKNTFPTKLQRGDKKQVKIDSEQAPYASPGKGMWRGGGGTGGGRAAQVAVAAAAAAGVDGVKKESGPGEAGKQTRPGSPLD